MSKIAKLKLPRVELMQAIKKQMRSFTPIGASYNSSGSVSKNYVSAVEEIKQMQLKYDEERAELYSKLHNSPISCAPPTQSMKRSVSLRKVTSLRIKKSKDMPSVTPRAFLSCRKSINKAEKSIEKIITKCHSVESCNIQTPRKNPYEQFKKILERQEKKEIRNIDMDKYVRNQQYLLKSENKHLYTKDNIEQYHRGKFDTLFYVNCKVARKKIWKPTAVAIPKRIEHDLSKFIGPNYL